MVLEAGKEILNLIMGNVAGWLSAEGEVYNPLPPRVVADLSEVDQPGNNITLSSKSVSVQPLGDPSKVQETILTQS